MNMRDLNQIFEELSHIEYMVKESNSTVDSNLVYEGFWDTVRKGAEKIGQFGAGARNLAVKGDNAVKSGINWAKELGQKVWDKVVALGQEFIEWVKMVKQKAADFIALVKATPAKIWSALKEFYQMLATAIGNKIQEIKTGWDMFVVLIDTFVFKPIVNWFKDAFRDTQMALAYLKYASLDELKSLKQMAIETKDKGLEKWNTMMTKLADFFTVTIPQKVEELGQWFAKIGKAAGLILAGLITLPFYAAFKGGEFVYKLGERLVYIIYTVVGNAWDDLKAAGQEALNQAKTIPGAIKAGYENAPKVPVKENKRNVLSFDDFLRRN